MTKKTSRTFLWILSVLIVFLGGFLIARAVLDQNGPEPKSFTFTIRMIVSGDFTIDMTPKNAAGEAEISLTKTAKGTFTITNAPIDGFDAKILFLVSGLPPGSFSFSANPANAGQSSILTIDGALLEPNTTYVCSLVARFTT